MKFKLIVDFLVGIMGVSGDVDGKWMWEMEWGWKGAPKYGMDDAAISVMPFDCVVWV